MFLCLLFSRLRFLNNPTHTCFMHMYVGQILCMQVFGLRTQASVCVRKSLSRNPNLCFTLFVSYIILLLWSSMYLLLGHMCFSCYKTYVMILCNWLILWQSALYLYLGRLRMCLNTSKSHVSRSSIEAFKSVQEIKQGVQIH